MVVTAGSDGGGEAVEGGREGALLCHKPQEGKGAFGLAGWETEEGREGGREGEDRGVRCVGHAVHANNKDGRKGGREGGRAHLARQR